MQQKRPEQKKRPEPKWSLELPFTQEAPKLLLVEGEDEWHLLIRLLGAIGIADIDVRSYGGGDGAKLARALRAVRIATDFHYLRTVAVWRDAEGDAGAACDSVKGALAGSGFAVPPQPSEFEDGDPRVGFLILPDGTREGSLEDVCLEAVAEDVAMTCVDAYIECLTQLAGGCDLELHPNSGKTKLHSFLASRPEPGKKIGQAAEAGYLNFQHRAWKMLIEFLRAM